MRSMGHWSFFDEVISGFRIGLGGAQQRFSVDAPLTCLGKIVGGGLPIGAYGGRREIMEMMAPEGPVYQAGTLSGNPIAVAAGLKTLEILERDRPFDLLERRALELAQGLEDAAQRHSFPFRVQRCGSMFTPFFNPEAVTDFVSAKRSNTERFNLFFRQMLGRGIYLAPSQFEANFVSAAHTEDDIQRTLQTADQAFREMA